MNRSILSLAVIATLSGCGAESRQCATADAKGVVAPLKTKAQFASMLKGVVGRTQTASMIGSDGEAKLPKALDEAVERHGSVWDENIMTSWAKLSTSDLQTVCNALNEGDQATFMRYATQVGGDVQQRNEPVLKQAAAEVLAQISSTGQ